MLGCRRSGRRPRTSGPACAGHHAANHVRERLVGIVLGEGVVALISHARKTGPVIVNRDVGSLPRVERDRLSGCVESTHHAGAAPGQSSCPTVLAFTSPPLARMHRGHHGGPPRPRQRPGPAGTSLGGGAGPSRACPAG